MEDEKTNFQEPSTLVKTKNELSDEEDDNGHGYETDSSSGDSNSVEKCPICLLKFGLDQIGKPSTCEHSFCFPCIEEWSKVVRTCPIDRKEFTHINVYDNIETNNLLKTVAVGKQISINEYIAADDEYTACEICGSIEREDVMLLCDGCDKGFHMDCLDPPMDHVPVDNWYCQECESTESSGSEDEEESDVSELNDLQEEIENEIGTLPATRLRNRPQHQIVRTLQSERIRNAIMARRTRSLANVQPSTSTASTQAKKKSSVKRKRKATKNKRSSVIEYEIRECGGKFPMKKRVKRRKTRKRKNKRISKKCPKKSTKSSTSISSSAKSFCSNPNVFELQHARHRAGVSNFNIFEPTNHLDYIPDDDENIENEPYFVSSNAAGSSEGGVLLQGSINTLNPLRRKALIKKRVIDNFTTTSNSCDLIDSILNEKNFFEKPSNQVYYTEGIKITTASDDNISPANLPNTNKTSESSNRESKVSIRSNAIHQESSNPESVNLNQEDHQNVVTEFPSTSQEKLPLKKKKPVFDMFDEKTPERKELPERDECPNFSIYNNIDDGNIESAQPLSESLDDLVQMSDEGEQQQHCIEESNIILDENEPVVIFKSQPASPDLENDDQERSYTPPLIKVDQTVMEQKSSSNKDESNSQKNKNHSKRQELERYNVRDRLRDKTPLRKDRFGRNKRSKSRSRSHSHHRRKSRSKDRKHRHRYRSDSRRRDSSSERRRKKSKRKKSVRKSRSYSKSESPTRRRSYRDDKSPKRHRKRDRTPPSPSEKSKKKKYNSKEKSPRALTKEIYTSGQNILVSVNFSQAEKRPSSSTSRDDREPIVDITTKKKINVSSKPVAIIDLARSPFKELTPEYKKESNVIELSDSDGEKNVIKNKAPKSPDSTKLYDPFDILNSPSNGNVSSSQQNAITNAKANKIHDHRETTIKGNAQTFITQKIFPPIQTTEENLVTSSSNSNAFEKIFQSKNNKIEVFQNELIQNTNMGTTIESPYSPGGTNDDATNDHEDENESSINMSNLSSKPTARTSANLFDELFGSSSPPGLDRIKSGSKKCERIFLKKKCKNQINFVVSYFLADPTNKYINKLKRQERVIEEVKGAIKPHYSKRAINKEQYKEIMRKAVPKVKK